MKYGVDLLNRNPQSGNSQNINLGRLNQHTNFGNLCLIESRYNKLEGSTRNPITDRKFLDRKVFFFTPFLEIRLLKKRVGGLIRFLARKRCPIRMKPDKMTRTLTQLENPNPIKMALYLDRMLI